jgi:peptide/nickel transport system ATP-binding protein
MKLLEVSDLQIHFRTDRGVNRAVDGLSFAIDKGEALAIVGESGCGKSVTSMSVLRLLPTPPGKVAGDIRFRGEDLLQKSERQMRRLRGGEISMIFQEPMSSLNPVYTIGKQISEAVRLHKHMGKREARQRAIEMLTLVGIPSPEKRVDDYPHQLSGGMRQRVMIAMALACDPALLIADEPTTALDVTIQAQILDLLRDLRQRTGTAILLITHDLGVVAEFAERVLVMYAGRKVEEATVGDLFTRPMHPYTKGLMNAVPKLGYATQGKAGKLTEIPGRVPDLTVPFTGCVFAPRCPQAQDVCSRIDPALETKADAHLVACHFADTQGHADHG